MDPIRKQRILYFVFLFVLIFPNIVLVFTERLSVCGQWTMLLFPLGIYTLLLSTARKPGKPLLWLFPVLFLGAFQLVLTYLFKQGPIAVDMWLNLTTTNSAEADELLQQLTLPVSFVVVFYIPLLVVAIRSLYWKDALALSFRRKGRRIGSIVACGGLLIGVSGYWVRGYEPDDSLFPLNACYNCYLACQRAEAVKNYHETSRGFRFKSQATHPADEPEIIVFVVGETNRADNWQLYGYERPTTPCLAKESGLIVYPDMMSQSNATHKSVPILMSLASAEDFDVLYTSKGIISAYKEAGFHTCFFSNQMRNHSFIDFLGNEADEVVFVKDRHTDNPKDGTLIPYVQKAVRAGHTRLFIVLHTYGSHFDYNDRYNPQDAFFQPDEIDKARYTKRNEMLNAYDNTIRYTDRFLADILEELRRSGARSALLYISDHGEDIYDDDRRLFLHASPYPSYYQLHVPFVIWTSGTYAQAYPDVWYNLKANRKKAMASDCVFHTLLHLGGIGTVYRNDTLSLGSEHFKELPRHYLDDHNEPQPLDKCLDKEDLRAMARKGMRLH